MTTTVWHSMNEIPVTPEGTVRNFALAFRSKERGGIWVEEAQYLNAYPLDPDDDNAAYALLADEESGQVPFTGWFNRFGREDDEFYQGISMDNGCTEVLGWADMPEWPEGMTVQPVSDLWCCHVRGPDDVMACDDKAHAERVAKALHDQFGQLSAAQDVMFDPVAAPWPHSAEAHARDLAAPSKDYVAVIVAARDTGSELST